MDFRKVNAIIRSDALEKVEQRLHELGVPGISVTRVKGYGEYKNFYTNDWITTHARVEIFTSGTSGDGIVAVLPVEKVYKIRHRAEVLPDEST